MKKVLAMAVLAGLVLAVSAYGARRSNSDCDRRQSRLTLYQIDPIEKTWHKAASLKNLNLFMSHLGAERDGNGFGQDGHR